MKEELKSGLVNLQGLEFIYEKSLFPDLEYIFRHALVQEVAYNSLLLNRRKEIHEKIGQAIESLYPQRLEEFYEMLAYHYSKSGNSAKAYQYLKASAEKAVRGDATFESVRFFKEAMEVLSQLPQTDENKREQIGVVLAMQMPLRRIGWSTDYLPMLQKAEAVAEELGDEKKKVHIRSILGAYYILKGGDPQLGWKYLESCLERPEMMQDAELMITVGFDVCISCQIPGHWQRISHVAPTVVTLIERSETQAELYGKHLNPYAAILGMWGLSIGLSGDFEKGERLLEKALPFAHRSGHLGTVAFVEYTYSLLFMFKGDFKNASGHILETVKYAEESQTVFLLGAAWTWLGYTHALIGPSNAAVDLAEKGLKMHIDFGIPFFRSCCHLFCSFAHFEDGDMAAARTHAELALQFSLENNETWWQGLSRIWLGRVIAKTESTEIEAAKQQILKGISLLEELKLPCFSGYGYLWLGEVYAESGRREEALENLKKAETMFRDMGMDYWLGKAQEALARL